MKLGVSSYSFLKYFRQSGCSYFDMCDKAKAFGYDGIEFIDLDHTIFGLTGDALGTARELRTYCEKIELQIIAYTVKADFLKDDMEAELSRLCRCVDVAAELGAKVMRHDVCFSPRNLPRYTYHTAIEETAESIRTLAAYAATKGITTCTENHGRFLQDPQRVEALIRAVNHPNFGWLLDLGNFTGVDAPILEATAIAAPYAVHIHAKDQLWKPAGSVVPEGWSTTRHGNFTRSTMLGHGVVPLAQCIQILKSSGYDGTITLEYEGWEDNLQALEQGIHYLRRLI